jgi:hypothetical protein
LLPPFELPGFGFWFTFRAPFCGVSSAVERLVYTQFTESGQIRTDLHDEKPETKETSGFAAVSACPKRSGNLDRNRQIWKCRGQQWAQQIAICAI